MFYKLLITLVRLTLIFVGQVELAPTLLPPIYFDGRVIFFFSFNVCV